MNNTQKKPQLEDIAEALGLSKSTVSRAISGKGRIKAETRERVFECIRQMNYRPNMIAKSLSERKTYNIGVVIPTDSSEQEAPFFQTCLMGISKECAVRDYDILFIGAERDDYSQLTRVLENRKVDGIIVSRPTSDGQIERLLDENGMPFVVIGRSVHENSIIVDSDHLNGCKALTSYLLLSTPAESIGLMLGNMAYTVNKSRYSGFVSAFNENGSTPDEELLYTGLESSLQFSKAAAALLRKRPRCIICGDDMLCMKLIAELNEQGIKIPQDIRVASFYDSVFLNSYTPPITSLIFNAGELGAAAAAKLHGILSGEAVGEDVMLDYELLIRRSTM